ncbi:MAG: mechanosensitive ion channel family protein [Rhodothermales bacterium]
MMDGLDTGAAAWDNLVAMAPRLLGGVVILVVGLVVARLSSRAMKLWVARQAVDGERRRRPSKAPERVVRWGVSTLAIVLALQFVGLTGVAASLLATGGVVAIILGFAFKEIGENLLAGLLLSFSRSFDEGDLIESNGFVGLVKDIRFREVHVRTADGRDVFIPSAAIFRNALQNYTRDGLRQGAFIVGVDYGDDPEKARQCVLDAIRFVDDVLHEPPPAAFVHELGGNWVELRGTFWIDTFAGGRALPHVRSAVLVAVHKTLRDNGFTFTTNVSSAHEVTILQSETP